MARTCAIRQCKTKVFCGGLCTKHYTRKRRTGSPHKVRRAANGSSDTFLKAHVSFAGSECLEWPYSKSPLGYPFDSAHRKMCQLAHGDPPEAGLFAAHKCGRPSCVNPSHLYWATPKQNSHDRYKHGTIPLGEKHARAKLSSDDVRRIRLRLANGERQTALAREFGVSPSNICMISKGRTWASLCPTENLGGAER